MALSFASSTIILPVAQASTVEDLEERRQQDQQECEAEHSGSGPASAGTAPPPITPPPTPPTIPPPSYVFDNTTNPFLIRVSYAQTSIGGRSLSEFTDINSLRAALQQSGGNQPLNDFLGRVQSMGGNMSQLRSGYSTVGDLTRIPNLNQMTGTLGQLQVSGANFGQLLNGFNNAGGLFNSLNQFGGRGLGDLTQTLGQFNNLGGNFNQLTSGFSNFSETLSGLTRIGDLKGLGNTFGQLGNLGGNMNRMLGDFGDMNKMLGSLGNISNLQGLSNSLGQLKNLNAGFGDIFQGADGFSRAINSFGNIRDLNGITNALGSISRLGGNFDKMLSGFGDIGGALSQLDSLGIKELSDLSKGFTDLSKLGKNFDDILKGDTFAKALEGLGGTGVLTGLTDSFPELGALSGGLGGLDSVPVREVGELLEVTKNTDQTTSEIRDTTDEIRDLTDEIKSLQIQSCTHLKVIRRIQLSLEEKYFVHDPNARKNAVTLNLEASEQFRQFVLTGRLESPINTGMGGEEVEGESLISQNLEKDILKEQTESVGLFHRALEDGKIVELKKTISEEEEAAIFGRESASQNDSSIFFSGLIKRYEPGNSMDSSFMSVMGMRNKAAEIGEGNAKLRHSTNQGYKDVRVCAKSWVEDPISGQNVCPEWKTVISGADVANIKRAYDRETIIGAIANTDAFQEDCVKATLRAALERFFGYADPQKRIDTPEDLCKGVEPDPETGWGGAQTAKQEAEQATEQAKQDRERTNQQGGSQPGTGGDRDHGPGGNDGPGWPNNWSGNDGPGWPSGGNDRWRWPTNPNGNPIQTSLDNNGRPSWPNSWPNLPNWPDWPCGPNWPNNWGGWNDWPGRPQTPGGPSQNGCWPNAQITKFAQESVEGREDQIKLVWESTNAPVCQARNDWAGADPSIERFKMLPTNGEALITNPTGTYTIRCYNWLLSEHAERTITITPPGQ